MSKRRKAIITCAITGAAHTPCMSPYLPVTPEQTLHGGHAQPAVLHTRRDHDGSGPDLSPARLDDVRSAIARVQTGGSRRRRSHGSGRNRR
jgi:uncharacterized protein (DUF849 family)